MHNPPNTVCITARPCEDFTKLVEITEDASHVHKSYVPLCPIPTTLSWRVSIFCCLSIFHYVLLSKLAILCALLFRSLLFSLNLFLIQAACLYIFEPGRWNCYRHASQRSMERRPSVHAVSRSQFKPKLVSQLWAAISHLTAVMSIRVTF